MPAPKVLLHVEVDGGGSSEVQGAQTAEPHERKLTTVAFDGFRGSAFSWARCRFQPAVQEHGWVKVRIAGRDFRSLNVHDSETETGRSLHTQVACDVSGASWRYAVRSFEAWGTEFETALQKADVPPCPHERAAK